MKLLLYISLLLSTSSFAQPTQQVILWLKRNCDNQIAQRLGLENCKSYVYPVYEESSVTCKDSMTFKYTDDSIYCEVTAVEIAYNIVVEGDTIHTIRLSCDRDLNLDCPGNHDWRYDLKGYKALLNGKFPIDYKQAAEIVRKNDYDPKEYGLALEHAHAGWDDLKAYEYQGSKFIGDKTTKVIYVDAFTGEFSEVLMKEVEIIFEEVK